MTKNDRKVKIQNINTNEIIKFESIKKANVFLHRGVNKGLNKIIRCITNKQLINDIYKITYDEY